MESCHRQLEHIKTILNSITEGVFTVDEEMKITSFNQAAEQITGFTPEEALGRKCHEIFRTGVCTSTCPLREALRTGEPVVNREVHIVDKGNRRIPISVSASVLRNTDGEMVGGVETFRDLSLIFALRQEIQNKYTFQDLVSRNPAMRGLFDILPDISASEATVLLQGESGTGKELFARAIHNLSHRKDGPLVVINCGALPEPLLEAEIFGARKGAYTGATENRSGRMDQAQKGTLFLDEIGDLPLPLQVKLLRVLENREYQPLGAPRPQKADVRFMAATHRNLEAMVEEGTFRRDLYFRINVVALQIPPLRDRREDIPLLIDFALARFNRTYGKKIAGISSPVMEMLLNYSYPGNVRELINIIEQSVILCRSGEIELKHLPRAFVSEQIQEIPTAQRQQRRTQPTREELQDLLKRHQGNRARILLDLGVDRSTLWRWLKRHNLD
jgi:PAS domain S-box-containing protein